MKSARVIAGLLACASGAQAKPAPKLTDAAAALAQKGAMFLAWEDNLALPLQAGAKGVPFLQAAAKRLEVIAPAGALLAIDGDAFRIEGGKLVAVAAGVGTEAAASADGKVLVGIEEGKKALRISSGGPARVVKYRRQGRWELEQPYVGPDGSWTLVALRDYTQPLDAYSFLFYEMKSEFPEEISLSKSYVPGALRQPMGAGQVGVQVFTQATGDDGIATVLRDAGVVVFDAKTRGLGAAPAGLLPGVASAGGRYSLLPGAMVYDDDKRCGGDVTQLHAAGAKPQVFRAGEGVVVSGLDFVEEKFVVASWLEVKKCRNKGVLIPLAGDAPPSKWPPFGLPVRQGRVVGRVIVPGK